MKWNDKEVKKLIKLHKSGLKTREIADQLDRTVTSVGAKINELQQRGQLPYKNKRKGKKTKVNKQTHPSMYGRRIDWKERALKQHHKWKQNPDPIPKVDSTATKISSKMQQITELLLSKNDSYGDSALSPIRVFSKSDGQEQLKVRIDYKLNRLIQGNANIESDKDVIMDLVGYLVLLLIAMDSKEK